MRFVVGELQPCTGSRPEPLARFVATSNLAARGLLGEIPCDGKHFIRASAHANVFGEINPTDGTRRIHEKFGWARDVLAVGPAADVKEVVVANHFTVWIGEDRKGVTGFGCEIARDVRRINADGYGPDASAFEVGKEFLDASQLEVAVGSPIAAIENEEHGLWRDRRDIAGHGCEERGERD